MLYLTNITIICSFWYYIRVVIKFCNYHSVRLLLIVYVYVLHFRVCCTLNSNDCDCVKL